MDPIDENLKRLCKDKNIDLLYIKDIEKKGKKAPAAHRKPSKDDLCTICYSSGTTGLPVFCSF